MDYCKIDIEQVKNDFISEQENIIKVLLCNLRLEEIASQMKEVFKNFKDDFGDDSHKYSDKINIKNEDLCNFIENKSLTKSELNRTFTELYELFERTIKLILEYIHYKKPEIIFNKSKQIEGNILNEIIKDNSKIERIMKRYIEDNVNKIMYSKNIKEIMEFVYKHLKVDKGNNFNEALVCFSTIRNSIVHNKGIITEKDFNKAKKIFEKKEFVEDFELSMTDKAIKVSSEVYTSIILNVCNSCK